MPDRQPRILSLAQDAFGRTVVTDEDGVYTIPPQVTPRAGSTFGVNVSWANSQAEIRWSSEADPGNNRSLVHVGLYGKKNDSYTTYGTSSFLMRANGDGWSGWYVTVNRDWVHLAQRDVWVGHDAAGAMSLEIGVLQGEIINTSCNNIWGTQWHGLDNYVVLPNPPFNLAVRSGSVATTSFIVDYTRSSYDTVDQDEFQWALDAGFTQIVWTDSTPGGGNGSGGSSNPGAEGVALTPGTTHYVRGRSHTGAGWSGWSGAISQATLPAVPPGLTVSASPSGTSATLTFSPPGGVSGVTKYVWERRVTGTTTPVATGESTVVTATVSGLTPGTSYDWRASAYIGTYQSPWGNWLTLVQPKPNTNPGDYFDGDSTDVADLNYGWTEMPGGSTSTATAQGVAGWEVEVGAGAAVLYRVTAGIFSAFAARVQVTADTAAAGQLRAGQSNATPYWTEVTAGATYIGSIHVRPSRGQRLAAEVTWMTSAGATISVTVGAAIEVAGAAWTRLVGGGVAPANAAWAAVRVIDVAGTGWSIWKGGDTLDLDGAMISLNEEFPYFDGATLSDGQYIYEWTDPEAPHASTSTRTPIAQVQGQSQLVFLSDGRAVPAARAITDPDCAIVPPPPRPPTVPSDCIEDVGVWRRYYTAIPSNLVPEWMDVVPTLDITSGSLAARQVRIRYYANPDELPPEQVDTSSWLSEQIISFMPAGTVMTLDGVTQRVWAEVNGSDPVSADHLLYGTNGKPATWPILSCGIAYLVSVEVPIAEPAGNIVVAAALTART